MKSAINNIDLRPTSSYSHSYHHLYNLLIKSELSARHICKLAGTFPFDIRTLREKKCSLKDIYILLLLFFFFFGLVSILYIDDGSLINVASIFDELFHFDGLQLLLDVGICKNAVYMQKCIKKCACVTS